MNIENISKEKGEVLVMLSKDDLVGICNALYRQTEEQENKENILQLYSDMMMARDLCQYLVPLYFRLNMISILFQYFPNQLNNLS